MKSRKVKSSEAYAVMSLNQIRQLLAVAEADSLARYGEQPREHATVIIRGWATKYDGKVQSNFEEVNGVRFTY